jgi:ADP-dependent NAD(P)H-hydrate dehydratase / NAD(P)H-hydrate epimerase
MMSNDILLSVAEMYEADAAAVARGVASLDLMEAAGKAVFREILKRWRPCQVAVLCGPGNNGGDGFVVARLLRQAGWPVRLALLGQKENLAGDAKINAERWEGPHAPLNEKALDGCALVVDALFGAGLSRPLEGVARTLIEKINAEALTCISVDMPSGVHGDTGQIMGIGIEASVSVTFCRKKPGHLLMPGRLLAGDVVVADIGIPDSVVDEIKARTFTNSPRLWLGVFPWPQPGGNKYRRGHALIAGSAKMCGAARLAALTARRIGAGLVSLAVPPEAFAIYASGDPGNIVLEADGVSAFRALLSDERKNAVLVGPGAEVGEETRQKVFAALDGGKKSVVLDAGALSSFEEDPEKLFAAIKGPCVLTPHEGEFARLFSDQGDKLSRARRAAEKAGAVVLLKGADTLIASACGRAIIDDGGPPYLATAGSGDVLAGLVLGLLAQGMEPFPAAAAAVWIQSASAAAFGPGLIAEDIIEGLPEVLSGLLGSEGVFD